MQKTIYIAIKQIFSSFDKSSFKIQRLKDQLIIISVHIDNNLLDFAINQGNNVHMNIYAKSGFNFVYPAACVPNIKKLSNVNLIHDWQKIQQHTISFLSKMKVIRGEIGKIICFNFETLLSPRTALTLAQFFTSLHFGFGFN